jgi:beta-barrel assembly-enhancing protease
MIKTKLIVVFITTVLCFLPVSTQTLPGSNLLKKVPLDSLKQAAEKQVNQINKDQINKAVTTAKKELLKPEEGIPLVGDLPDSDEVALGREWAGRLLSEYPVVKNDSLQRYVNLVGAWVAGRSNRAGLPWTFGVIESDDINAFSAPGGYVLITKGLYQGLRNEAELACVLGHEIAHVNLRHHVRLLQKERLIEKGKNFLIGQTKKDALKELAGTGAVLSARAFDKNAEFECDRWGVVYAARAGYDPFAYMEVLDRMGASDQVDRLSLLYKTHPSPGDRITALEKAIGTKWNTLKGIVPQRQMQIVN